MKPLQIDEIQAKKLYPTASKEFKQILHDTFGIEFFQESIIDKIKTLADIYKLAKVKASDVVIYTKPKNAKERYINACAIIPIIVKVYNQGKVLDWTNSNESKYLPYFKKVGSGWSCDGYSCDGWDASAGSSCALYYAESKNAIDVANKFKQIYIDYISYQG